MGGVYTWTWSAWDRQTLNMCRPVDRGAILQKQDRGKGDMEVASHIHGHGLLVRDGPGVVHGAVVVR